MAGKGFIGQPSLACGNHISAGGTPRDFGPRGDVLDRNCTLLFKHFERRYPYFLPVTPLIEECLLVPFYVGGKAVRTIWAITHSDRRKFDAEDERLMNTLGNSPRWRIKLWSLLRTSSCKSRRAKRQKQRCANWPPASAWRSCRGLSQQSGA